MSTTSSPLDRLPPHDIEAERGTLGCLMLEPQYRIPELIEKLPAGAGAFYDLRHADLCAVLIEMHAQRIPIDLVTLTVRLRDSEKLEACGGLAYVNGHMDVVGSAANLPTYLAILRDKLALRRILQTCSDTVAKVQESPSDLEGIIAGFERDALAVRDSVTSGTGDADIKAVLGSLIELWQSAASGTPNRSWIKTGFRDLDNRYNGMRPGEVLVIAARPGMGKTTLALNIADNVMSREKAPVGIVSMEMTDMELMSRLACSRASVDARMADDGRLSESDLKRLTTAMAHFSKAPLSLTDKSAFTVGQIAAKARRWRRDKGIKLLIVDYLGLIRDSGRQRSRYEAVSDITRDMKALAKELGVPVMLLCQLNRASENDDRPPRLADLRDSGSIEQDADFVWLLHPGEPKGADIPVMVKIAKARRGPTAQIELMFRRQFTRFEDQPFTT